VMESTIGDIEPPLPAATTPHPPGSPQKIAAMRERVERGESVFHPHDAKPTRCDQLDGDTRQRVYVSAEEYDRAHRQRELRHRLYRRAGRREGGQCAAIR
jgi:hypothetical protein